MASREDIIRVARTYIDTPFHHQGRIKGVGVDCVGLIIKVAHELQLSTFDITGYSRVPDGYTMEELLDQHMQRIPKGQEQLGDVLLIKFFSPAQHVAIYIGPNIIHARGDVGKVVEHNYDALWRKRTIRPYRFYGVN